MAVATIAKGGDHDLVATLQVRNMFLSEQLHRLIKAARLSLLHPLHQPPRLLENLAAFKVMPKMDWLLLCIFLQIAQNLGIAMEGSAEDGMKGVKVLRSTGLPSKVLDQVGLLDPKVLFRSFVWPLPFIWLLSNGNCFPLKKSKF